MERGQPIATTCSSGQTVNPATYGGKTTRCRCTSRVSPSWEPLGAYGFRGSKALRESCRARNSSREDPSDARFAVCMALALVLRSIESKLPPSRHSPRTEFPLRGASRHRNQRALRTVVAESCDWRSVANGDSAVLFGSLGFAERGAHPLPVPLTSPFICPPLSPPLPPRSNIILSVFV